MDDKLSTLLTRIDWTMLAKQKLALIEAIDKIKDDEKRGAFLGLLNLIDELQNIAEEGGFPVVWLDEVGGRLILHV